jgi:uncharacterized protein (DUF2141 family)
MKTASDCEMGIIKNTKSLLQILAITGIAVLATQCAKQGTPTGGPKDETPPKVVSENPPNRTVLFNYPRATITFDEFITLKDATKEIFVSPPMRIKPEYKVAGKKLIIEFQEALKDNSTYTINFGNSIIDFTEGNPLVNYEYVFSTGEHLDSLSIPGMVLNAFDLKPEEGIIVMVYQDDNDTIPLDSLPYRVQPKSASKTTKDGSFRINNLAAGPYKLFALEDLNNNYIFDLPNERIAFLDSMIKIMPPPAIALDTLADTLAIHGDTILPVVHPVDTVANQSYTLYLYSEEMPRQKLLGKKLTGKSLLQYIFLKPVDSLQIIPDDFDPGRPDWYITEMNPTKDTVNFWLKPGLPDTINVIVQAADSISDTSRYILSKSLQEGKAKKKDVKVAGLPILSSAVAGALDLNKKFTLSFGIPVEDYEPGRIHLFSATDTLIPTFRFPDTLHRKGLIDYNFLAGEYYMVLIEDSVFCDLSGAYNDSTTINVKVRKQEDYGTLLFRVSVPDKPGQFIIQLLNEKDAVLRQKIITQSGDVVFDYLMPANYKVKMIIDRNLNGKWDTGKYSNKSLPEQVIFYPNTLSIRANWDMEEEWKTE